MDRPQYNIQTRMGEKVVNMTSTLVETVSINYEDFNESFLTCGTCLCTYDGSEHTPKLLPCSHTVCLHCLTRIAASQTRDTGTFRCPICRECINIPTGGVSALPPSFLVNQLLDLMARQRREVIPKCSSHTSQELLFCETCDTVFCSECVSGSHTTSGSSGEHTIIPFSIAIKRMSEILLYKANECIAKLNSANDAVTNEIHQLDHTVDHTFELINSSFQEIISSVDRRRQEILSQVKKMRDEKKRVLQEQLSIIQSEKAKVQQECDGLQYQVEVRNITKKIAELNTKLDAVSTLGEPRENSFITYEFEHNDIRSHICQALGDFGQIKTSKTFPGLCEAKAEDCVTNLRSAAKVKTVDYHGNVRLTGGDPIQAILTSEDGSHVETEIVDVGDGTYDVFFTPRKPGKYELHVTVFERAIKDSPLVFNADQHNNPVGIVGGRGPAASQFMQPVGVAVGANNNLFVVDTGNARVKVLDSQLKDVCQWNGHGLEGRSGTGIAATPSGSLVVVNWRTKMITELTPEGQLISQFTHPDLQEPIDVAVNSQGQVLVADNGSSCIFVLETTGNLLARIGRQGKGKAQFNLISAVAVGPDDEILVADSRIQVFSPDGSFLKEIYSEGKGKGRFGGIVADNKGHIIATRTDKARNYIQVFNNTTGELEFCIDSHDYRLKRPSGVAVLHDGHVVVVDLGNDCIKKYRYQ